MVYKPSHLCCNCILYYKEAEHTNLDHIPNIPVTPEHLHNGVQISLLITPIQQMTLPTENPNPTLINQLTTPCQPWAKSMWHKICPHDNLYWLHKTIGQGHTIFLVSDTSVNHQGQGTLAWIIHSSTKLWLGEGIIPGPVTKVYSGLAEAYGMLTALSFLQQYVEHFLTTINVNHASMCVATMKVS